MGATRASSWSGLRRPSADFSGRSWAPAASGKHAAQRNKRRALARGRRRTIHLVERECGGDATARSGWAPAASRKGMSEKALRHEDDVAREELQILLAPCPNVRHPHADFRLLAIHQPRDSDVILAGQLA